MRFGREPTRNQLTIQSMETTIMDTSILRDLHETRQPGNGVPESALRIATSDCLCSGSKCKPSSCLFTVRVFGHIHGIRRVDHSLQLSDENGLAIPPTARTDLTRVVWITPSLPAIRKLAPFCRQNKGRVTRPSSSGAVIRPLVTRLLGLPFMARGSKLVRALACNF